MTTQRQLILDTVKNCCSHPSAAEVYDMVRENHKISLATVYNSLNYLAENGYIMRVAIAGEADRFDGKTLEHHHAICDKCGKIFDVEVYNKKEALQKKYGIKITSLSVNLRCICPNCLLKTGLT